MQEDIIVLIEIRSNKKDKFYKKLDEKSNKNSLL